jgi:CheY-like chemotaxis protein
VFWNVLKNAQKFTPANGTVHVQTRVSEAGDEVTITVTDSGIGMTADELGRVFIAFSQGDHAERGRSHRFGGLGLGLAISRMLVQLHFGRLTAASEGLNRGSSFSISLPLARAGASNKLYATATPFGNELTLAASPVAAFHILVVEDHDATRHSLAVLLTRRGHQIETAASVAEALARAEATKFDFVISDLSLPDGDGCELMAILRQRHGLKGIAMTGYGMEQDIARTLEAGFVSHLTKPVSMQSLDAAIASFGAVESV